MSPPLPTPGASQTTLRRWLIRLLVLVLVLAAIELLCFAAVRVLMGAGAMAYVPWIDQEAYDRYLNQRNPLLGWGPEVDGGGNVLGLSPRSDPLSRVFPRPKVSVYGDSFSWGSGVQDRESYPHWLAESLKARVDNFGQAAFGTDQALLLFRAQRRLDQAPVVVLGHVTENILRNVCQYRQLVYPGSPLQLKPRFLLVRGQLQYLPPPGGSWREYVRICENPRQGLPHDYFVDRPRPGFPFTWSLARYAAGDYHFHARLKGVPRYLAFYHQDHPSGALALTKAILAAFHEEAIAQKRLPLIVLIPTPHDIDYYRNTGRAPDQSLADWLKEQNISMVHATRLLAEAADAESLHDPRHHHLTSAGNRRLADLVAREIQQQGWSTTDAPGK